MISLYGFGASIAAFCQHQAIDPLKDCDFRCGCIMVHFVKTRSLVSTFSSLSNVFLYDN